MTSPVAILAIADVGLRERIGETLSALRWRVVPASGGAEALAQLETGTSTAVIADGWLPDLEIKEFLREVQSTYPDVDLISIDGSFEKSANSKNKRRGELLYALRLGQERDGAAFNAPRPQVSAIANYLPSAEMLKESRDEGLNVVPLIPFCSSNPSDLEKDAIAAAQPEKQIGDSHHVSELSLPEFTGSHKTILEICRRVRLVAPRHTPVLIQGPSGSGKELVARALHRLSPRLNRPFIALNCAAIPEALLEAELFGHTKGAFTGAVQARTGRIEAANGGTLFLDEIGELPLHLQAKLLRFVEAGELQKVGDNETLQVDVRIIAASHRKLADWSAKTSFRMDLYFRLAVFLIETPPLVDHLEDLPALVQLFLTKLIQSMPAKQMTPSAIEKLCSHRWPGNVRELAHVVERSYILAEDRREITAS